MSFVILAGSQIGFLIAWLYFRFRDAKHADGITYAAAMQTATYSLSLAQLLFANAFMVYAWIHRDGIDWFHFGYVLHIAALSMWQTIFAAVAIHRYLWRYPLVALGVAGALVMMPILELIYIAKFHQTANTLPHCYDALARSIFGGCVWYAFIIYGLLVTFLFLTAVLNQHGVECNPTTRRSWFSRLSSWPVWAIVLLLSVPTCVLALQLVFMFSDINRIRPWIDRAGSRMDLGQTLILAIAIGTVVMAAFNASGLNRKPPTSMPIIVFFSAFTI